MCIASLLHYYTITISFALLRRDCGNMLTDIHLVATAFALKEILFCCKIHERNLGKNNQNKKNQKISKFAKKYLWVYKKNSQKNKNLNFYVEIKELWKKL